MESTEHASTVYYTTSDDGIHVDCSCGWTKAMGYLCSVEQIEQAWNDHVANPH